MTKNKKTPETFWKNWSLETTKGEQVWEFRLPDDLKNIINTESDWDRSEGETYLKSLSDAFVFDKSRNPNSSDKVYRNSVKSKEREGNHLYNSDKFQNRNQNKAVKNALMNGFTFFQSLQTHDGNWPGDYGGPMFLLPGLIIVSYITDTPFEKPQQVLIKRYLLNHQNEDGGWGLHIEDTSTMFGTVMQFVALRLLGADRNEQSIIRARQWIKEHGGATYLAPWGKFYLSILGCYPWKGIDSLLPELWLLPRWLPFHPANYWNHTRLVYLPMSYCYAKHLTCRNSPLIDSLKEELFDGNYETIDWKKVRSKISESDNYQPISRLYRIFNFIGNSYEKIHSKAIRKKAVKYIIEHVEAEDNDTSYINLGPVNQVINSLCVWDHFGKESIQFQNHQKRWKEYLWLAEDGLKMNGYNGSQLWDTAFAGQALMEAGMENQFPEMASGIYRYLDVAQVAANPKEDSKYFRTSPKGGWPFSTARQGWPTADCTAEGLKTTIQLANTTAVIDSKIKTIEESRLKDAVDYLLMMQNKDGGWASYEEIRGPKWLEKLNPSRVFGNIMIEHSYSECTSATMQGLLKFHAEYSSYRTNEINDAVRIGSKFIKKKQLQDGSWYGSWAVCFTYATWFGIEGLISAGESNYKDKIVSEHIQKACEFLISKQREDGSWGESWLSCVEKKYIEHSEGQVINTSWALLGLMAAKYPDNKAVEKGIQFLLSKQEANGDWPQQGISGVFNGNCMITYTSYRNVFPLWTLGRYLNKYQNTENDQ